MRKRAKMDDTSEWRKKKYDHLMVKTLMSDDEDELDDAGQVTGRYVSRAPLYRNTMVSFFLIMCIIVHPHTIS